MPTSTYCHIPTVARYLQATMPDSVLDIGVGNGKMGFIVRDILDVMMGERCMRKDWKIRLDGIEVFPGYIQDHQRALYDDILIGDAYETIDGAGKYDLLILGDVLEHFEKRKAWRFLDKCAAHSNRTIMINIPLGDRWTQGTVHGNPHEEHRSFWNIGEFELFTPQREIFGFPGPGEYGCLLVDKDDYLRHRIIEQADTLASEKGTHEALIFLEASLPLVPKDKAVAFLLVDLLLKGGRTEDAILRLKRIAEEFPDDASARQYLKMMG
ncbi:MAG: tetratricopeptide repeat protein [Deltaproteobacteria bacterium]|nr:tetratricopeptide repeat protein [Deltaproteobacteria bacterium]